MYHVTPPPESLYAPDMSLYSTNNSNNPDHSDSTSVVLGGHAFVISCSAHTVYDIQTFRLQAASEWLLPSVNNSAHFLFQAVDRNHRGGYRCSYSVEQVPGFLSHTALHLVAVEERHDVRLVGGASRCEGELEVLHQSQWRPISYGSWQGQEGGMACRQLGCDILLRPNISISSMMVRHHRDDGDSVTVPKGHSFTITCSVQPQYPGGTFNLLFAGTNTTAYTQPAINHTAHFLFPAAVTANRGKYTCVYLITFHTKPLTSESSILTINIWKCEQQMVLVV
ncbi:hypothetical protein NHX12_017969 [Muraenolepis orangiensis]|uniref:Ig-like domain-containing protein n=1 Tax=Muraenolepis orangiensis TaxID=630683 RepID=A0A9Q0IXL3_9TELE|nr:hypothetical protein NHX12_017969 [Muraenolepis orangiensis]